MTQIPSGVNFPPIPATEAAPRSAGFMGKAQEIVRIVCQTSPRTQIAVVSCGCVAGSLFVAAFNPTQYGFYPQCFLYKTTGIYCPGCGATRAVFALLHGRFLDALHDNVVIVCALPLIAWATLKMVIPAWQNNRWPEPRLTKKTCSGSLLILATLIAFSLVRNMPLTALDVLRPNCEPAHVHLTLPQRSPIGVFGY